MSQCNDQNSAVYGIVCLRTGHVYVGSSMQFRQRLSQHFAQLRNGAHPNRLLQRHFNQYGERAFSARPISMHLDGSEARAAEHDLLLALVESTPVYNALHCLPHPWGERLGGSLHPANQQYKESGHQRRSISRKQAAVRKRNLGRIKLPSGRKK